MLSQELHTISDFNLLSPTEQEAQRLKTLTELGLVEAANIPIFDEAAQTAAHLLEIPICILGVVEQERERFKSAVGLSRMGLMNDLAISRQILRQDSLAARVVERQQVLAIADTQTTPDLADNPLIQRYGVRAYLGVPLMAWNGHCLGALSVMDALPREFSQRDVESLQMIARWCISEYERKYLMERSLQTRAIASSAATVRVNLIAQMTEELRTPLTSILGMASVLTREFYGPLTEKQKEYMGIIHHSGQYLLSLVNEIVELGAVKDDHQELRLSPVDVEMLCQQALHTLQEAAVRREQQVRLTVEPGHRIWLLDKEKVRQMVYHLTFSVIQASSSESTIRVHVSRKGKRLNLSVWTSHPWMGEGVPQVDLLTEPVMGRLGGAREGMRSPKTNIEAELDWSDEDSETPDETERPRSVSRQSLGLLLCRNLAELHSGQVSLQGSIETGYRYVISLPQMDEAEELTEMGSY